MPKFKVTLTARVGKNRPTVSVVVEADNPKDAMNYVRAAIAPGYKSDVQEVQRQTLRAAV